MMMMMMMIATTQEGNTPQPKTCSSDTRDSSGPDTTRILRQHGSLDRDRCRKIVVVAVLVVLVFDPITNDDASEGYASLTLFFG